MRHQNAISIRTRATPMTRAFISLFLLSGLMSACASDRERGVRMGNENERIYTDSNAAPETWSVDYFTVRKPETIRSPNDYPFYYKHCSMDDNMSYYSKTSYWCTDP